MWGNSGFGGKNPAGSGGFVTSPKFPQSQTTPSKPQSQKAQNVVPLSIANLYNCLKVDDIVKIGETEAGILTVVGLIRRVEVLATVHIYEVDDMTGPCLQVKKWLEDMRDNDEPNLGPLVENTYARFTGVPRKVQGNVFMVAVHLKPIVDFSELTTHLLETMKTKLVLEKGFQPVGEKANPAFGNENMKMDVDENMPTGGYTNQPLYNSLTKAQAMVLELINSCPNETNGYHISYLFKNVPLSQAEIKGAIKFLAGEGHIYTTSDDETFKGC